MRGAPVVVGLAPAAHGGNRTGRSSPVIVRRLPVRRLHRAGFASQPASVSRGDGLRLTGV